MSLSGTQIASLVLCWLAYAALHSVLASFAVAQARGRRALAAPRAGLPARLQPARGAAAGATAVAHLAWRGPLLWSWDGGWAWLANVALALAAVAGFPWSTRYYDMGVFYGSTQWRTRERAAEDPGGLRCRRCTATSATPGTASGC